MTVQIIGLLNSPPVIFFVFFLIGWLLLVGGQKIAAEGEHSQGKYSHYSCGEDLEAPSFHMNYHEFFRLALLFGILHIVALVIATIPTEFELRILPTVYVISAGIAMYVLLEKNER